MRRRRNTRWTVPLIREAIALREEDGLSYRAISVVLARYHGLAVSEQAVRYQLRAHGVPGADRALTLGNLAVGPGGPLRRDVDASERSTA